MGKLSQYAADNLPDNYLAEIGRVIFLWGRLEYQLSNLLEIGFWISKETGRALTIGMDTSVKCGVMRTLAHNDHWIKNKSLRDEIRALAKDIGDKSDDRNSYAHSVIGFDLEKPKQFCLYLFYKAEHRIKPSSELLTLEILKRHAGEARGLLDRAIDLTVRLKALHERSLGRRP